MLGNNINLKLKNARLIGANGNVSNNSVSEQSDYIDEDYSDYVVKNDIPEMKLLPMDYVPKAIKPTCPPPPPPVKCKCVPPEPPQKPPKVTISEPIAMEKNPKNVPGKYLVYKRRHSIFGAQEAPEKLQYVTGNNKKAVDVSTPDPPKAKENKRKYLIFDSKKSSSKLDSIQYYFDNKSYEKYVDNKLYGKLNQSKPFEPKDVDEVDMMKGFENSRSWEYRDASKTESKLKRYESKLEPPKNWSTKSEGSSTSGASSCSEISLKRRNCRVKPQMKFTTSKSISDLSMKTSHDVNRINQLFANAKPLQAANFDQRDKYKIHRKLAIEDNENVKNFHRSSTELKIKASPTQHCGFKNCKFTNCPISNNHGAVDIEKRKNFDENFIKKFEDMRKNSSKNEITVNKSSISVNGKNNIMINDTKNNNDVFIIDKTKEVNNSQNKTTIKINESCFVVNHSNELKSKNVIELNGWDKNIKVKNNLNTKCDKVDVNNKIRNEKNSVKIYVSGNDSSSPTPSTSLSISSSDSDRDYGYFDTSSQGRSSSPEFADMFKKFRQMCKVKSPQNPLGCDGTMFWNNSFFDEDETDLKPKKTDYACTKCHTTNEDLLSNYICICRNKVNSSHGSGGDARNFFMGGKILGPPV